jgi:hypothetical protein
MKPRQEAPPPQQQAKPGAKIDISKQLHKTKMCMHFLKGKCRYGPECSYAHSEIEIKHRPNLRKTRLCKNYEMAQCDNPNCPFAHGGEELRGTDGVWKTVMCAKWLNGTCRAGSRCRFAHGQHELQDPPAENFDIALDGEDISPPISPAFYPSPMPMSVPGLPYHENPTPTSYDSVPSTQPESFSHIAMASLMHAMSTLDAEPTSDSPGVSPTHSERAEPPPIPTKWGPKPQHRVEENHLSNGLIAHLSNGLIARNECVLIARNDDTQNAAKLEVFKSTPQRPRPNRPLSPLSPTALNCLPSGLFSPGSLPMPKHLLAEASW